MRSICRACSHMVCRHRIGSSRLTHSSFVRLLGIDLRVIRAVSSSSSFIRYGAAWRPRGHHPAGGVPDIPNGLRPCVPLPGSSDTGDGEMMFSSCQSTDGIDGGWRRRSISGGLLFRYDPALVRLRHSVLLFAHPIRKTGRGIVVVPRPVVSVSRNYPRCSGR